MRLFKRKPPFNPADYERFYEATNRLRWKDGTLQQFWFATLLPTGMTRAQAVKQFLIAPSIHDENLKESLGEWRDVPAAPDTRPG